MKTAKKRLRLAVRPRGPLTAQQKEAVETAVKKEENQCWVVCMYREVPKIGDDGENFLSCEDVIRSIHKTKKEADAACTRRTDKVWHVPNRPASAFEVGEVLRSS
jgi:hypothetical protein